MKNPKLLTLVIHSTRVLVYTKNTSLSVCPPYLGQICRVADNKINTYPPPPCPRLVTLLMDLCLPRVTDLVVLYIKKLFIFIFYHLNYFGTGTTRTDILTIIENIMNLLIHFALTTWSVLKLNIDLTYIEKNFQVQSWVFPGCTLPEKCHCCQ